MDALETIVVYENCLHYFYIWIYNDNIWFCPWNVYYHNYDFPEEAATSFLIDCFYVAH